MAGQKQGFGCLFWTLVSVAVGLQLGVGLWLIFVVAKWKF